MPTMDIFEGDAFSIIELTRALETIPYKPATLSGSGLFDDRGVRSRTVVIESREGTLSLIPFSERGSPYEQQIPEHLGEGVPRPARRAAQGCGADAAAQQPRRLGVRRRRHLQRAEAPSGRRADGRGGA